MVNAIGEGQTASYIPLKILGGTVVLTAKAATFALRAGAIWGICKAINMALFPEEEESLSTYDRMRPHLIIGRNEDGSVRMARGADAAGEFLSWFGLTNAPVMVKKFLAGQYTWTDMVKEMGRETATKAYSTVTPFKAVFEAMAEKSGFPDATRWGKIRDRKEHLARMWGLDPEYRALMRKPGASYLEKRSPLWTTIRLDEANYNEIMELKREFVRNKLGKGVGEGEVTAKSEAYYNYKKSLLYKDKENATKYLNELADIHHVTVEQLKKSIKYQDPYYGLPGSSKQAFYNYLTPEQRDKVKGAERWYRRLSTGSMK